MIIDGAMSASDDELRQVRERFGSGTTTINRARAQMGLPPVPWGPSVPFPRPMDVFFHANAECERFGSLRWRVAMGLLRLAASLMGWRATFKITDTRVERSPLDELRRVVRESA